MLFFLNSSLPEHVFHEHSWGNLARKKKFKSTKNLEDYSNGMTAIVEILQNIHNTLFFMCSILNSETS